MSKFSQWVRMIPTLLVLVVSVRVLGSEAARPPSDPQASVGPAGKILVERIERLKGLQEGRPHGDGEVQSLFDCDLRDERSVAVEIDRLRTSVSEEPNSKSGRRRSKPADTTMASERRLRQELDRERLAFLLLPRPRRDSLLDQDARRRQAAAIARSEEDKERRRIEMQRQKALEEAQHAKSETDRVVAEEMSRLLDLQQMVDAGARSIQQRRDSLNARLDEVVGWQRRTIAALKASPERIDSLLGELNGYLEQSRIRAEGSLSRHGPQMIHPSLLEPDLLAGIPGDSGRIDSIRALRARLVLEIRKSREQEDELRQEISHKLVGAVVLLNQERLKLIPRLSAGRQQALKGVTKEAVDEVRRELRLLHLVLRYHQRATLDLLRDIRIRDVPNYTVLGILSVLVPWLLLLLGAVWFTRRSKTALSFLDQRLAAEGRFEPSVAIQRLRVALRVLRKIRLPLEWIVFLTIVERLLPESIRTLLEVQLLSYVVRWVIGGFLVVHLINALASGSRRPSDPKSREASDLRLRSLRLVGWVVVGYAIGLGLSSRLVGEGVLHSWIRSTSWIAAIPVYLVLVGWWRSVVFERIASLRRKTALQSWILAHPDGWRGFLAAMLAAIQLFTTGSVKIARRWMSGFQIARRAHAYLFKREIDRLSMAGDAELSSPLPPELFQELSPDRSAGVRVPIPQESAIDALRDRALAGRGGIVAMVAERGQGKSTTLRHLHHQLPGSLLLDCLPHRRFESIKESIEASTAGDLPGTGTILLDESQALVRPAIGGLEEFDRLVKFARASGILWILAIDSSLWPFLSRARDQQNLFDEILVLTPWPESVIGELLEKRSEAAQVAPDFQDLVGRIEEGSDEQDRLDAIHARKAGYVRMLWNHVRGNPGLALEAWRGSLVQVPSGTVRVRSLRDPDPTRLERLPDQWLFILRAVLQLSPASVDDVLLATRLPRDQVAHAFRQGKMDGFFEEPIPDHVRVSWQWLRSVDLLLERRHLLVNP